MHIVVFGGMVLGLSGLVMLVHMYYRLKFLHLRAVPVYQQGAPRSER
jgi:hypothetical protein